MEKQALLAAVESRIDMTKSDNFHLKHGTMSVDAASDGKITADQLNKVIDGLMRAKDAAVEQYTLQASNLKVSYAVHSSRQPLLLHIQQSCI